MLASGRDCQFLVVIHQFVCCWSSVCLLEVGCWLSIGLVVGFQSVLSKFVFHC